MPTVYSNGRFLPEAEAGISPLDRGFLFADAIYEVVRYDRGRPYRAAEHLERMREGLAAIRIAATTDFFEAAGQRLLAENGLLEKDAFVYAQASRGAAPRYHAFPPEGTTPTVFAFAREVDPPPAAAGGRAILLTDERWGRCDIKSVMLLPNVLAAQTAREAGAVDRSSSGRVRARGHQGEPVRRRERRAADRAERAADPAGRHAERGDRRGATDRPHRGGARVHRRGDVRGARRSSSPRRRCGPIRSWRSRSARSGEGSRAPWRG